MKKIIARKLILLLLTIPLAVISNGQKGYADNGRGHDGAIGSYQSNDNDENEMPYGINNQSEQIDQALKALEVPAKSYKKTAARPGGTLSPPPDCPECTPDPGGGVVDVPFDKNLLIILFAGAIFIILKWYKRNKKIVAV